MAGSFSAPVGCLRLPYDTALAEFGSRGLVELTNLMGYYSVLAFNINAFEQLPPPSDEPILPV